MLEFYLIIHCLFSTIQFLIGVLANGLILVVNGTELIKRRKMVPLALLLSCLAIARICLQSVIFYIDLAIILWIEVPLRIENFLIFLFVNELGLWFASWLGVFYCAKVAPIAQPLLFWLKMRISKLVPWLIPGSLLYTSTPSIFYNKHTWAFSQQVFWGFFSPNTTTQIKEKSALQLAFLVRLSLPLLIFLALALVLIFSPGRHTWQMRDTATGPRVPSTGVHVRSLLSALSFLVLCVSHYMAAALLSSQIFKLRSLMFLLCVWVFGSFPSGHSMILILGSPKLKQNAKKLLLRRKCRE